MHKGRLYELRQEYRTYNANVPYPHWFPEAWVISTATWAGTASALVPPAPLDFVATGVDAALNATYECTLFDFGGGVHAILKLWAFQTNPISVEGRILGDWGINGSLPNVSQYDVPQPSQPFSSFFSHNATPAEAYLRPTRLIWAPKGY